MSFLTDEINYNDDQFFEVSPPAAVTEVKLSHLNNKSSGLCPTSKNITSQYLALQQLEAHQRMVSRAKAVVDNSAPVSLQSYINVTDKQKKKLWQRLPSHSKSPNMNETYNHRSLSAPRVQETLSEEEDNASLNASSVSKIVQTDIPFVTISSKTADKISWYLEALSQGELFTPPFVHTGSQNSSHQSNQLKSTMARKKRITNRDILETHVNCFIQPKKSFSPRILANTEAKSKIKGTRCYNPPSRRRRKHSSTNSSDTFESYDQEEDSDEEEEKEEENVFNDHSEDVETQINKKSPIESNFSINTRLQDYLYHHSREKFQGVYNQPDILKRNEEDKYLDFLSKVTEDILRSGVYSDSAIQQAFEFHMQFYQDDENKDKLQSLLSQVLEGLKIKDNESDEVLSRRNPVLTSLSRPNSPPEKETS